MKRQFSGTALVVAFAYVIFITGCGGAGETPTNTETPATSGEGEHGHDHDHDHEDHDHDHGDDEPGAGAAAESAEINEAMAMLSDEDRPIAEAQVVCLVGGEPLGSMGKPYKVTMDDGRVVFLCCEGCEKPLKADPEKYLAKLKANQ